MHAPQRERESFLFSLFFPDGREREREKRDDFMRAGETTAATVFFFALLFRRTHYETVGPLNVQCAVWFVAYAMRQGETTITTLVSIFPAFCD